MGVLRHPHAPEDDGGLGARVSAGDGTQRVGIDAANRRHLLGREIPDVLGELREALREGLHILPVVELLGDDHVEERVEHRDVGAVAELQHMGGVALERLAARVHDDELGAPLGRLLEEGGGDRVIFGGIGADHDDDVGVPAFVEGGRHGRRADAFHQGRDRRRVAKPRAVIDIVGAEAGAHQFLEQVGLFVRAFGGAETRQRTGAVLVADMLQSRGGTLQRFLPGCGPEMGPGIARIDGIVDVLGNAISADHRLGEALRIVDIVEPEPAFHA